MANKKKLLFLVADARYFCTHRLDLAIAARDKGYDVYVGCPSGEYQKNIIQNDLKFIDVPFDRGSLNPFYELKTIWNIAKIYRRLKPNIVHHVALKPSLYGTVVARLLGIKKVINAVSGLGHNFTDEGSRFVRSTMRAIFRLFWRYPNIGVIVQNPDDCAELAKILPRSQLFLILSAGVNTKQFRCIERHHEGPIVITHLSRMLWTKGVGELVEATKILKNQGYDICVQLVGEPDIHNPASISSIQLQTWHEMGFIRWLGFQSDTASIYQNSHIAVLATYYREGVPKALTEAAACGLPIITTDMPGCREVVEHGENGFLVQPKNIHVLAEALKTLIIDPELRNKMGLKSREICLKKFDVQHVIEETLRTYQTETSIRS